MKKTKLAFIGAGNMARSLVGGLLESGHNPKDIYVSDINPEQLQALQSDFSVNITESNEIAMENADVCVLAIKPQVISTVILASIQTLQKNNPLIISIAAGVREADISRWIGGKPSVVRCMPNTPSLFGAGATVLYANEAVSAKQKHLAEALLKSAGTTDWVASESLLDSVTALSGSGPAYFFLLVESMTAAAEKLGLDNALAQKLAIQTATGAAAMLLQSSDSPQQLRKNVTSKGGTTEAAINSFESAEFRNIVYKGMECAFTRSIELGKQLGDN